MTPVDLAYKDAQSRIDAGRGTPADYAIAALLGKHASRLLGDVGIKQQSARDREIVDEIQAWVAEVYEFALARLED